MNIATTVNVRTDLLEKMIGRKEELNISLNRIVSLLLSKTLTWQKKRIKTFEGVKYQIKEQDIGWHKLHISLDAALYERCLDMRKLYKLSVSYILAICIQMYLYLLSRKLNEEEKTDNYHNCYLFFCRTEKKYFSFTIYWGLVGEDIIKKNL